MLGIVLTAGAVPAAGQQSVNVGETLGPAFDTARLGANETDAVAPSFADPAIDAFRQVVDLAESLTYTVVVGLENGSAGSDAGTPESAGVEVASVQVRYNVSLPDRSLEVPAQTVNVSTPVVNRTVHTPPVETPGQNASVPGASANATVPGVGVPGIEVHVPGRNVSTGPIGTPPVNVSTPPIVVPEENVTVDLGNTSVTVQGINGTLFVANESFPVRVNQTTIRLGDVLPGELHEVGLERGQVANVSNRTVHVPPETLHPGVTVKVPGVHEEREGQPVTDEKRLGNASVGETNASASSQHVLDGQTVHVKQDGVRVGSVHTPSVGVGVERVSVANGTVATPAVNESVETPFPVDDVGYTGWGRDDDASTYPFACALSWCLGTQPLLDPFVGTADACLDAATQRADGRIVLPSAVRDLIFDCYPFYGPAT